MTSQRRLPYSTPTAFRRALTDKLRTRAAPHGPWTLADLQRQFAYDRLLTRLYMLDNGWILKASTEAYARRARSIDMRLVSRPGGNAKRRLRFGCVSGSVCA